MTQHRWLVDAVVEAGLPEAERLRENPLPEPLVDAWETVSKVTGMDPGTVADAVARHFRIRTADLDDRDAAVLRLVPEKVARRYVALPLREDGRSLQVAVADPSDFDGLKAIGFAAGRYIDPVVAPAYELSARISTSYGDHNPVADFLAREGGKGATLPILVGVMEGDSAKNLRLDLETDPTARLAALLFQEAISLGASDLHLEPMAGGAVARYRVEGVLAHSKFMPRDVQTQVVAHVKAIAGMDPTTRIRPQDGRARLFVGGTPYDLRISTLPAGKGENMVVRILSGESVESLSSLKLVEPEASQLRALFKRSAGIVVMTGPTGSGKSTTLVAAIKELSGPGVDIHTVEDPVEYKIPGVVQVEVDERQGLTFAAAIRSILRQDPDVLLVGEIRDAETAEAAKQAALTGHLVLSTLHTQDAPSAVFRLKDLGVDPSYLAEILAGACAQRLVRTLCPHCAKPVEGELSEEEARFELVVGTRPPKRAAGCPRCRETGYKGRVPIAQVFTMTPSVADLITEGTALSRVRALAHEEGMRTLSRCAADLVEQGDTTPEEVLRVLGESFWLEIEYEKRRTVLTEDHDHRAVNPTPESMSDIPTPKLDTPQVLVLEEDDERRRVVAKALREMGYEVHEALHASDARAAMRIHQHISLMVVSLDEEGRTAREVLHEDYQALGGYAVPSVIIIPPGDQEVEPVLRANGAVDYIYEPFDPEDLKFRVAAAVRRHEMAHGVLS